MGALLVVGIHAFSLGQLVHFTSDEAGKDFFGEGVVDGLAYALFTSAVCLLRKAVADKYGKHVGWRITMCVHDRRRSPERFDGHTLFTLVVLKQLHAFEGGGTADELMGEFGLVIIAAAAVDLLVGVFRFS